MFTAKKYIVPESLQEAYELNQSRSNKVIGGCMWLRMGKKSINTLIDLSGLGLNETSENEGEFNIGAMCTLRQLEQHSGLEEAFGGLLRKSVADIVGVQFRNTATVGGSVYSRFGFSDLLTALMALDTYVELYKEGSIRLKEYANRPLDNDILVGIRIKKNNVKTAYQTMRNTATDFPVLALAAALDDRGCWKFIYGARPGKALEFQTDIKGNPNEEKLSALEAEAKGWQHFGSNIRGSREYRSALAPVLLRRAVEEICGSREEV